MIVVFYRWRIRQGFETQFIEAWSDVTKFIVKNHDSLGSRLHRDKDGIFYGYAQWKTLEQRENAFREMPEIEAVAKMREAIEETFPEIILNPLADLLIFPQET